MHAAFHQALDTRAFDARPPAPRAMPPSPEPEDAWSALIDASAASSSHPPTSSSPHHQIPSSHSHPPRSPPRKRQRHTEPVSNTLFFPDVAAYLPSASVTSNSPADESALRLLLPASARLRLVRSSTGRTLAWAELPDPAAAHAALHALPPSSVPTARARFHRGGSVSRRASTSSTPRSTPSSRSVTSTGNGSNASASNSQTFSRRQAEVIAAGGLAHTLLFVNLPTPLSDREFETILPRAHRPLRLRSAQARRAARHVWAVYADATMAAAAHAAVDGTRVILRSGHAVTLRPRLHDDAADRDEARRRRRTLALGAQDAPDLPSIRPPCPIEKLEGLLRASANDDMPLLILGDDDNDDQGALV